MAPGEVGDQRQPLVCCGQPSLLVVGQQLGVGGECGDVLCIEERELLLAVSGDEGCHRLLSGSERRTLVDEHAHDVEVVVRPLCAVDQRTALHGDLSAVGYHFIIRAYGAHVHVEVDADDVPLLPCAVDGIVSVGLQIGFHLLVIDEHSVGGTLAVGILIEV